jgi:hypothetical protein
MAEVKREQTTSEADPAAGRYADQPVPAPQDPGGAHAKGYSADPDPAPAVSDQDPLPLAPAPEKRFTVEELEGRQESGRED